MVSLIFSEMKLLWIFNMTEILKSLLADMCLNYSLGGKSVFKSFLTTIVLSKTG